MREKTSHIAKRAEWAAEQG